MEEQVIQIETEHRVAVANGGPNHHRKSPVSVALNNSHRESKGRAGMIKSVDAGMTFTNVCVDADSKRILWDVSGKAVPGQMLAIMGPSGKKLTSMSIQWIVHNSIIDYNYRVW